MLSKVYVGPNVVLEGLLVLMVLWEHDQSCFNLCCCFYRLPSLTQSHQHQHSRCTGMAYTDSLRAGRHRLWAIAKRVLPPSGRAHSERAGGPGAERCELKYFRLVTPNITNTNSMNKCACCFQNASVTVIHVPDDKYRLPARIVFQYLLTPRGEMYELQVRRV